MVTATHRATLIGIFDRREDAHNAVEALHRAGFRNHQITMVMHHKEQEKMEVTNLDAAKAAQVTGENKEFTGLATGVVAGGLIGGAIAASIIFLPVLGPVLLWGGLLTVEVLGGLASGVVAGAVGGGLVGALVGLDFPEAEARRFERELKAGRILVGVKAGDRAAEAHEIIRAAGGRELEEEMPYALPPQDVAEPPTT